MLACRRSNTRPEVELRSVLHRRGLRFRVNARPLPRLARTADVVFRRARLAVFVDGCFWHACPDHFRAPVTNGSYWAPKIQRNVERDRSTDLLLVEAGWLVLRFWEHESPDACADRIEKDLKQRLAQFR